MTQKSIESSLGVLCICYNKKTWLKGDGPRVISHRRSSSSMSSLHDTPFVVSPYFYDPRQHHWLDCKCPQPTTTLSLFPRLWEATESKKARKIMTRQALRETKFRSMYGSKDHGKQKRCMVCHTGMVSWVPGGGVHVSHIIPRHEGGSAELWNLVCSCSCNLRYKGNLIDFMGADEALCKSTLKPLCRLLWKTLYPLPWRQKQYKQWGSQTLVKFIETIYNPPFLIRYAPWLHLSSAREYQ